MIIKINALKLILAASYLDRSSIPQVSVKSKLAAKFKPLEVEIRNVITRELIIATTLPLNKGINLIIEWIMTNMHKNKTEYMIASEKEKVL